MIRRDFHLVDDTAMSTVCLHATTLSGTCKNREGKGCGRKMEKFSRTHKLKRTVVVAARALSLSLLCAKITFHFLFLSSCCCSPFILFPPSTPFNVRQAGLFFLIHPSIHSAVVLEKLERHYPSSLVIQSDCIPWQQTIRRTDWVCAK